MNTPSIRFSKRIANLTGSVAREILSRTQNRSLVSFAGGLPDPQLWERWELPQVTPSAFAYGPSEGEACLRETLASKLRESGVPCDASNLLITSGSQQGIDLAAKLFIDPETEILIESPTYLAALQVFRFFGARMRSIPLTSEGIDLLELKQALRTDRPSCVYLNPTYQNPSGIHYSHARRVAVAELLDRHDCVLIEDDPYRQLSYDHEASAPIVSHLKRAPWIYLGSLSKVLMPGLRIGYLASSPELFDPLVKLKQAADLHSSRISQSIAQSLLADENALQDRIERMRLHYRRKRDCMHKVLNQHASDIATWQLPEGGMFFWLRLKAPVDQKALLARTLQHGMAFMPGDPFLQESDSGIGSYLRLNFTNPSENQIEQTLPVLLQHVADAIHEARSSQSADSNDAFQTICVSFLGTDLRKAFTSQAVDERGQGNGPRGIDDH
jgi:2-aminoadipate transaminase